MRKLTGLFIAAAVTGTVWWQLPNVTGRSLTAQTGRTTSSSSTAYQETARRLMQQAQAEARQGNTASAKRLALQASRFPVQWATNELSPTQLLSQLQRGSAASPQQLNPATVAGRQPETPTRLIQSDELVTRAVGTASNPAQSTIAQTSYLDSAQHPAATGTSGDVAATGATGSTAAISPLHKRVNDYMARARTAWQNGDRDGAIRQATVARLLADDVTFQSGEETPDQLLNRLRSSATPTDNAVAETNGGPAFIEASPQTPASQSARTNPFAEQEPNTYAQPRSTTSTPSSARPSREVALESTANRKQYADGLLSAAKEDLKADRLESAYEKALLASQVDTVWNLFDETPEQVLSTIRRIQQQSPRQVESLVQSGNSGKPAAVNPFSSPAEFAAGSEKSFSSTETHSSNRVIEIVDRPETKPSAPQTNISDEQLAKRLVSESRQLMRDGRFDEARASAIQAKNLNTSFDIFSDRPDMVLRDIDRLANTLTLTEVARPAQSAPESLPQINPFQAPAGPTTSALATQNQNRTNAQKLLSSARDRMRNGDFAGATDLVQQARNLKAAYSLFDERPEIVMADIERLKQQFNPSAQPASPGTANPFEESAELLTDSGKTQPQGNSNFAAAEQPQFLPEAPAAPTQRSAANPFDKPAQLLSGLADSKPQATQAFAATSPATAERPAGASNAKQAAELLGKARQMIQAGRLDEARDLTQQAEDLDVIYELFDDRPSDVYAAIDRVSTPATAQPGYETGLSPSLPIAQRASTAPAMPASQPAAISEADPFIAQLSPAVTTPVQNPPQDVARSQRDVAQAMLKQARADLSVGNYADAMARTKQVRDMDLTFGAFDDRPELLLADIAETRALQQVNIAANSNIQQTSQTQDAASTAEPFAAPPSEYYPESVASNAGQPVTSPAMINFDSAQRLNRQPAATYGSSGTDFSPTVGSFAGNSDPYDNITTIHPSGISAEALYNEGRNQLRQGDRDGAYQAFLEAWQSGQKLDPYKSQQLQDYLRELAPRRQQQTIQLTSGQASDVPDLPSYNTTRPIDVAAQREQLKFDRLRTEVQNSVLRADTLKEKRPDESVEILDRMMAELENSGFDAEQVAPMVRQLRRSRTSIDSYIAQRAPIIDLQRRNEEVKAQVTADISAKVRIGQEFASLVDDYNKLYKQRRYAEAQVIAKQAKELDPQNPVAVNMELKAMFARRNDSNDKLRDEKEQSFWQQLDDVEQGAIVRVGDKNPMVFGPDWKNVSKRRLDKYGNDMRSRTDEEKQIEESLSNKISLHFENTPLIEVIRYIRTATGTNVAIDLPAIEDEGVTTNTQVTIDVDNIMVQSALNLMLEPLNLGYSIENEVLKITSKLRQQGRMVAAAYPVADLVVPMRSKTREPSNVFTNNLFNQNSQMSVSSVGGVQNSGMFQVGSGQGQSPFMMGNGSGMDAQLSGSGQEQFEFDTLVDLLTSVVEPDSWQEVGGLGTIKSNETTLSLVIRQTQEVHREISDLLDQLRRLQDLQVTIEVRLVNVSDNFFERIGVDFDFDIQDTVGGPNFDGGATQGGQGGGGGQQGQQGGGPGVPLPAFGTVIGGGGQQQGQQGQGGGQQGQQQGATQTFFTPSPNRELTDRDSYPGSGTIIGLAAPGAFTSDLDIAFQQGSFDIGVPDFGNFQPNAGLQVGLAILSDIETFFFIQAAQGDERSNLLFAPKVTLFNGDTATIFDQTVRPFVLSLQPTVGAFSVGFTPQIGFIPDGITLTVTAVISADRRFVRLALAPFFNNLIDLQTFSFLGGQTGGGGGQQGGGQQGQGGQQGGGSVGGEA